MSRQHTSFGKGAPNIIPTNLNQHYLDLYNRKIYVSRGKTSVDDWGSPIVDEQALQKALRALELPGNAIVTEVFTTKTDSYPTAKLDPASVNSQFVILNDNFGVDPSLPESYVLLNIAHTAELVANMEFVVYNSTPLKMRITGGSKVRVSFTKQESFIAPYGIARLKLLSLATASSLPRWLVAGDVGYDGMEGETDAAIDDVIQAITAAINDSIAEIEKSNNLG